MKHDFIAAQNDANKIGKHSHLVSNKTIKESVKESLINKLPEACARDWIREGQ